MARPQFQIKSQSARTHVLDPHCCYLQTPTYKFMYWPSSFVGLIHQDYYVLRVKIKIFFIKFINNLCLKSRCI